MSQLCELTGDQECWGVDVVCCYSKLLAILKDVPEKDMVSEFLIDGVDKTDEVIKILDLIALSSLASGRCSGSLVTQLYCEAVLQGELAPERVISEIRALENPEHRSITKPAMQFNRHHLKGLWHKHYRVSGISSDCA